MKIITFYHFDFDPRFAQFSLYVRCKSGVTFVRRCFRDGSPVLCSKPGVYIMFLYFAQKHLFRDIFTRNETVVLSNYKIKK